MSKITKIRHENYHKSRQMRNYDLENSLFQAKCRCFCWKYHIFFIPMVKTIADLHGKASK